MGSLYSFDIDGTLEVGDPSGSIPMELVRQIKADGHIVGSCSDRPVSFQQGIWERHRIEADFTVVKDQLEAVKAQFSAETYYHIGDTDMDEFFAGRAGFHFIKVDSVPFFDWSAGLGWSLR